LFGVSYAGKDEGPMLNSYLSVNKEPSGRFHPILKDLEDSVRFINAVNQVSVTAKDAGPFPLQVVPTYPDLPMEEVFPPKDALRGQPGVIARQIGKGRVVYFPGDIDRTFWETLNFDQGRLLRNAVVWATDEAAPVKIEGTGVIDVSVWEQKGSMTVHMVNLTNPMMMKGPVREIIPIGAQELTVKVPKGRSVRRVRLLVAGTDVDYAKREGELSLKVPSIAVHEVVVIDFA
jgi:hypothetical protein